MKDKKGKKDAKGKSASPIRGGEKSRASSPTLKAHMRGIKEAPSQSLLAAQRPVFITAPHGKWAWYNSDGSFKSFAWVFFVSFIIINAVILLNMVIGVIVDVMMGGSGIDNLVNSEEDSKD